MKIKSYLPPIYFESIITNKRWIVCTGKGAQWIEVDREYSWAELEKMWEKIEYGFPTELKEKIKVKKEYKVIGSKGNTYKIVNDKGFWSCNCPAHSFGRGRDCKHIKQVKNV